MTYSLNETHDPERRSWVESANQPDADFPIQNLPLGVFRRAGEPGRVGTAIGDWILDLAACAKDGLLNEAGPAAEACSAPCLNDLLALGPRHWSALRRALSELLRAGGRRLAEKHLVAGADVELLAPARIGDYTDFYASLWHATNVGRLFRPDQPLLPNYKHLPVAYHGRASSIVVTGTPVRRPAGQTQPDPAAGPRFGPCRLLDYELEAGFLTGPGNPLGEPIPMAEAEARLFGVVLLNDWSARDIQKWEYQPLGPFLGKSFATSISAWVVTMEALEPFRTPAFPRPAGDPPPLPYLSSPEDQQRGGLDIRLEVLLRSSGMREQGLPPARLSRSNLQDLYWTPAQMLAHQASNGCNLRPGDLIGSGTVSGAAAEAGGCLLELTRGGAQPIPLPTGEQRGFLEDGDEVILRGWCRREGFVRLGLGECRGLVLPASIVTRPRASSRPSSPAR